jgi:pSer/pThr/pTyr-binding forkhead associated (FHA) protein
MQVVLIMFRADGERRSFSVTRDITVIGRREDCDLRIPLLDVSRKHCRLIKENSALRVEDLGSSNGTYLNGQRVQEAQVNPGDTVQLGPVVFIVQIDGMPADDQLQPAVAEEGISASSGVDTLNPPESASHVGSETLEVTSEVRARRAPTPQPLDITTVGDEDEEEEGA